LPGWEKGISLKNQTFVISWFFSTFLRAADKAGRVLENHSGNHYKIVEIA
jgi:hypothetical protein